MSIRSDRDGGLARSPALVVLVVGLLLTAGLAWGDAALYAQNESRLLSLRTRELGFVLREAVPSAQATLAAAASLADSTAGNSASFRAYMAPFVGPKKSFISASLWAPAARVPSVVVGARPDLEALAGSARQYLDRARRESVVSVITFLHSSPRRLGLGFSTQGHPHGFVVYVESVLAPLHSPSIPGNSAFAGLHYALYLGRVEQTGELLETDLARLPPPGRKATVHVPFGSTELTLLATASTSLGGAFFMRLRWIIAAIGVLLTFAAAVLMQRVVEGRRRAEQLAGRLESIAQEHRSRYQQERGISSVLQHALLPDALASVPGLDVSARYDAGAEDVEIGGDWYELFDVSDGCVLAIVGDVSGHDFPGRQQDGVVAARRGVIRLA